MKHNKCVRFFTGFACAACLTVGTAERATAASPLLDVFPPSVAEVPAADERFGGRLAGFFGFLKRAERVPGILQVYEGGQRASLDEVRRPIKGSPDWQTVSVSLDELVAIKRDDALRKDDASTLTSWATATELNFGWAPTYLQDGQEVPFGPEHSQRNGWHEPREFRNLRWEGGSDAAAPAGPAATAAPAPAEVDATIQSEIKKSL